MNNEWNEAFDSSHVGKWTLKLLKLQSNQNFLHAKKPIKSSESQIVDHSGDPPQI